MKANLLRGQSVPITINFRLWHFLVPIVMFAVFIFLQSIFLKKSDDSAKHINNLLQRLTALEAQTQRLNMLGLHLAKQTNVDVAAFNLMQKPALGGIRGSSVEPEALSEESLLESIERSERFLKNQQLRLNTLKDNDFFDGSYLEEAYQKSLNSQFQGYLSPVKTGYISSRFGMRNDPINGRHRFHKGIDIAGKRGTPINTIASGFVTFAGRKGGYGNVIEIHHSDSLKSRYAHLDRINVKKGTVVRKGGSIATMGSTGRVTGPHLHLEVWENGKAVNPEKYLSRALGDANL